MNCFLKKYLPTAASVLCCSTIICCVTLFESVKASKVFSDNPIAQNSEHSAEPLEKLKCEYRECSNMNQVMSWKNRAKLYIQSLTSNKAQLEAFSELYNNAIDFHGGLVRATSPNPSLEELNSSQNIVGSLPQGVFRLTSQYIDNLDQSGAQVKFYSQRERHGQRSHYVKIIEMNCSKYSLKLVL